MADYLTTDTELTSIANAIRTKGGTSASLTYPAGFVSAINDLPSGGGGSSVTTVTFGENAFATINAGFVAYVDGDGVAQRITTVYWGVGTVDNVMMTSGSILIICDIFSFELSGTWNDGDINGMTSQFSGGIKLPSRETVYYRVYQVD